MSRRNDLTISLSENSRGESAHKQSLSRPHPFSHYEVEGIRDVRGRGKYSQYLVKWKSFDESRNTWEPLNNLKNCRDLIREFMRRRNINKAKEYQRRLKEGRVNHRPFKSKDSNGEGSEESISDRSDSQEFKTRNEHRNSSEIERDPNRENSTRKEEGFSRKQLPTPAHDKVAEILQPRAAQLARRVDEFFNVKSSNLNPAEYRIGSTSDQQGIDRERMRDDETSRMRARHHFDRPPAHEKRPKLIYPSSTGSSPIEDRMGSHDNERPYKYKPPAPKTEISPPIEIIRLNTNSEILSPQKRIADLYIEKACEIVGHYKINTLIYFKLNWSEAVASREIAEQLFPLEMVEKANPKIFLNYLKEYIKVRTNETS